MEETKKNLKIDSFFAVYGMIRNYVTKRIEIKKELKSTVAIIGKTCPPKKQNH